MLKRLLGFATFSAILAPLPVLAQPRGVYGAPYFTPRTYMGWRSTDNIGQRVEKPTSPEEDDTTSSGQNVPLSQRIDPENPTSPSMNGTAD